MTAPNPGSDAAIAVGCICAVLDNNHGRYPSPDGWWITEGCPLHAPLPPIDGSVIDWRRINREQAEQGLPDDLRDEEGSPLPPNDGPGA